MLKVRLQNCTNKVLRETIECFTFVESRFESGMDKKQTNNSTKKSKQTKKKKVMVFSFSDISQKWCQFI